MEEKVEKKIFIPVSIVDKLPAMVRNELANLSPQKQEEFLEEYKRKRKSIGVAYLCWILFGLHYAYIKNWGMQVLFWLTLGGLWIWWIVDIFRIPGMINNYNKDMAIDIMRNLKAITG
jgi:hypothetical protein